MKSWIAAALIGSLVLGFGLNPALAGPGKGKGQKKDPEAVFKKKDKNGDGYLTLQEFSGKKGGTKAETRFKKLDKDNDGKVSLVELKSGGKKKKKGA
ncbi:MAG: EF-hand domain-containing protein [Isosphaeraceae bacterium]|nr:EF-hand domain-containing protein [Isosphaeraceae bacterium]